MDTDSFIVYIKTDYIYKDKAEDIETRFNSSNYEYCFIQSKNLKLLNR